MGQLKRFGEWVIALRVDQFQWARIKLTLWYLAMITAIVIVLSSSVYSFHVIHVERTRHQLLERSEGQGVDGSALTEHNLVDYFEDLLRSIILGDIVTIVIGGTLSYVLAGATLRPIRNSVETQSRFFANAAHDLRTPLAVMRSESEVALRRNTLTAQQARAVVHSGLEEVKRMSTMVERMMQLGQGYVASNLGEIHISEIPIAEVLQSVRDKMSSIAEKRGLRLFVGEYAPVLVRADRHLLERALYNVVENALRYTPSGGYVLLESKRSRAYVTISVRDSGIGIGPKDLPHVTEPFYRADRARSVHTGGSGLGLAIVNEIVRTLGGSMNIESIHGRGTTVQIRLRIA